MSGHINLVKLCVGAEKVEDLEAWQRDRLSRGPDGKVRHVTRMWPKRSEALLSGGSLYWVFKGVILARQRILRLDEVPDGEGRTRCGIVLETPVIRTRPAARKPFQGWRYLAPEDAPADLPVGRTGEAQLPRHLEDALDAMGVV